jgi:pyruvate kinase
LKNEFYMRRTKIIATVGPASDTDELLDALIAAGVDIVRLNFSHGTHDTHQATYGRIRRAAERARRHVAILQDLGGPKIRTGRSKDGRPIPLKPGESLQIGTGDFEGEAGHISTAFEGLAKGVHAGDRLLLSDGLIELRVEASDGHDVSTTVVHGGMLGEHKGINAPGVSLPASAITDKDIDDLRFGLSLGVDMVAISFVQTADDLREARRLMGPQNAGVPLIAKLERPQAVDHLDHILGVCDAVMVARGDLGLEMPLEQVPRVQKEITRRARLRRVPVIVATQVLESMTTEARPTRAEVSDAANAVEDGVDAIMLAGETASGAFPARSVETLDAIICDAESWALTDGVVPRSRSAQNHAQALCEAAVTLAERGDAEAIVAVTRGGGTARSLSALRPRVPIFATTEREATARRLSLYWGVTSVLADMGDNVDAIGTVVGQELVARGLVRADATIVLVNISPDLTRSDANYLKIKRL